MPAARHDLRRAAQGDAAPGRVGRRRGDRRALDPRHQGAGRLHGRHAAHDRQRHLHHQRHRARHRLADAPLAGRLLRPRQGQDALARASTCSPRASSPIAARGSTSSSTPRTSSTSASTAAASCRSRRCCWRWTARAPKACAPSAAAARARAGTQRGPRHGCRGDPRLLLRPGDLLARAQGLVARVRPRGVPRREADGAADRRQDRRSWPTRAPS